jgi:hypothetical protein
MILSLELRGRILYEICGRETWAVSHPFRDSLRFHLIRFLLNRANEWVSRRSYNEGASPGFSIADCQRMDTLLHDALPGRIRATYFQFNSHSAICHNPVRILQNGASPFPESSGTASPFCGSL